jgi:hypothetical protein
MTTVRRGYSRRQFLGIAAGSAVALGRAPGVWAGDPGKQPKRKTILSFYCDDTQPYHAGVKAFQTFLDYCQQQGIKGESSVILGMGGSGSIARLSGEAEQGYLAQVRRAWECGIDSHMELMTHGGLFDFNANKTQEGAEHEGVWLHEPNVTVEEYQRYFGEIIAEAQRVGIRFTGLTMPGCACPACTKRYQELRDAGHTKPGAAMWQALLNLAKEQKFRGPTVPCFFDSSETDFGANRQASDGEYGVYNMMPNAGDKLATYRNSDSSEFLDADYYLTADGKSGIIARHVEAGSPYCLWYCHWQGLNPVNGLGWKAFTSVIDRIKQHLHDRVIWMRPSDITNHYHKAGGWDFLDTL